MNGDMQKRAKLRCMHLLEKRDYSEKELRRKLKNGKTSYTEEEIDGAIEYVRSFHYVDDGRYADRYIACMSSRKSRRQIEQELLMKGIDRKLVEQAFEEGEDIREDEQIARWFRKKNFDPAEADQDAKRRMYAFLARKGFGQDAIRHAMKIEFE